MGCRLQEHQSTHKQLEACIADVRRWMAENMLKLNDDKMEYIVIGSRYMLRQIPETLLSIRVGIRSLILLLLLKISVLWWTLSFYGATGN